MALGLPGFSAYLFALRGYALGDTRTPFLANVLENGLQVALTVALVPSASSPGEALGTAYAIAYSVAGVVALVLLRRVGRSSRAGGLPRHSSPRPSRPAPSSSCAPAAGRHRGAREAAVVVVVGVAVFVAAGLAVGLAEIKELAGAVTGRRRTA